MSAADEVREILGTSDDVMATSDISAPCLFHTYDEDVQTDNFGGAFQVIRRTAVLVAAADFPRLRQNDLVTVNEVVYNVYSTRLLQDGAVLQVNLSLVQG
jgi:hypothetical protein